MSRYDKPEDMLPGEEYELATNRMDEEPLLPRYEPRAPSPSVVAQNRRERAARRRPFLCLALTVAMVVLMLGAGACYARRSKMEGWDKLPDPVKGVVDKIFGDGDSLKDNKNFPTDVGHAGPTPTGVEPALLVTAPALPLYTGVSPIIPPQSSKEGFNIMNYWGNLSPYHSVKSHGLKETSQLIPEHCVLDEMHWLQRHGARYPTSRSGLDGLEARIKAAKGFKAKDNLSFLNDWSYKLGAELLTPFGRSQLYNLGVSARVKYGFLLDRMKDRLPVFRTESQDRMLRSAQNFAAGFFGIPAEEHYNLEVMIEWPGFNCSLAPYHSCPNDGKVYPGVYPKLAKWDGVFLEKAVERLQKSVEGYTITREDCRQMMDMCAYETVALGHSAFCPLFTAKEWRGYQYRNDIYWWYGASFGSPVARAEGLGWLQELTARLTHEPLTQFNSSTNSTLHDKVHFPLNEPIYVDFTHDTTFAQLLPTLNLTTFAAAGPPPLDEIPKKWPFVSSKFAPFATNLQVQVLTCGVRGNTTKPDSGSWWPFGHGDDRRRHEGEDDQGEDDDEAKDEPDVDPQDPEAAAKTRHVRLILNDAPVPLTGINGCKEDHDGLCALDAFVASMHTLIGQTDHAYDCGAEYEYDEVTDGRPPAH